MHCTGRCSLCFLLTSSAIPWAAEGCICEHAMSAHQHRLQQCSIGEHIMEQVALAL
jgi:hypothetical protein